MVVVKRIFKYLKGTKEYGLWYPRKGNFETNFFTDVDCVGKNDDRKIMTNDVFFLGGRLVAWANKKNNCIYCSQQLKQDMFL